MEQIYQTITGNWFLIIQKIIHQQNSNLVIFNYMSTYSIKMLNKNQIMIYSIISLFHFHSTFLIQVRICQLKYVNKYSVFFFEKLIKDIQDPFCRYPLNISGIFFDSILYRFHKKLWLLADYWRNLILFRF